MFQHDDACKDFVTSLVTQNLMQCALGVSGSCSSLTSKERPLLFVTRQLAELVLTNGFKKVNKKELHVLV
jgi:hypothetical protein